MYGGLSSRKQCLPKPSSFTLKTPENILECPSATLSALVQDFSRARLERHGLLKKSNDMKMTMIFFSIFELGLNISCFVPLCKSSYYTAPRNPAYDDRTKEVSVLCCGKWLKKSRQKNKKLSKLTKRTEVEIQKSTFRCEKSTHSPSVLLGLSFKATENMLNDLDREIDEIGDRRLEWPCTRSCSTRLLASVVRVAHCNFSCIFFCSAADSGELQSFWSRSDSRGVESTIGERFSYAAHEQKPKITVLN